MDRKLKFEVSEQHANVIVAALGELPYKAVADLITDLRVQAAPQLQEIRDENQTTEELHTAGD